ncbi:similar to Saccharomyces cerevisiae YDR449C UTP6 Nucleolar protein [Geotrichum candidum]|uniref:Similar to Saccharomyces cerevisiae YDR449C UTP6 Nucleolar protein n=1 Tax=Geotrichum candidum TaxID=1173061 RepID=A0A0J9YHQ4_GEOCN|nr:similar to Saccharomyces cerevisiae YDR449C UTP6 Nucleolar protein [Geotrichum candidum]
MSEKVRYYLEQSFAELDDLFTQGLFTKPELNIIMRKRTDFEHRIVSRGAKPKDFLRYVEYEMNVERLRLKRVARLGVQDSDDEEGTSTEPSRGHGISARAGPRKIMFIFDRAVRKFTGDMMLWAHYIQYAKQQNNQTVLNKIYTRMLQLHPTKPAVWIMAAKYEVDANAAMRAARSIMQRGLRFNSTSDLMWIEYAKLELIYVCKILARRKLLGLVTEAQQKAHEEDEARELAKKRKDEANARDDLAGGADTVQLPSDDEDVENAAKAELKSLPDADMSMLGNADTNPALRGDVALAIYDAAIPSFSQYIDRPEEKKAAILSISRKFLDLFDTFTEGVDPQYLCHHVISNLVNTFPEPLDPEVAVLDVTLPIRNIPHTSDSFPNNLKLVINNYNNYIKVKYAGKQPLRLQLAALLRDYLHSRFSSVTDLEPNVALVIRALQGKCETQN